MRKFDFKSLFTERKIRGLTILVILAVVFVLVLLMNLKTPPPKQSKQVLICTKCNYAAMFEFTDVKKAPCPKCGSKMGVGMKCEKCDFEFPLIELTSWKRGMTIKKYRTGKIRDSRCPNCGSLDVSSISNYVWTHTTR